MNDAAAISIPGYQVLRKLGEGGTASVYLAIQLSFERQVALKIMSPLLNADPSFHTRFTREARIVAQMHHASIVPVFDVGMHQGHHYLSMEYLPGGDLRQRIVEGRCTPVLALDVCMAVASALDVAHRKGFVHRDIKPQNILFREDGAAVLTDFGIARAIDVGTSLTAVGMLVGTPAYMSPEQVKGLELDGRTDVYSLGIVLCEMLTGAVPFRADSNSALSVALMHLTEPLPLLPADVAYMQPLLDRMVAKDPEHRFASAEEVLRAIRSLRAGPGARMTTQIRRPEAPQEAAVAASVRVATAAQSIPPGTLSAQSIPAQPIPTQRTATLAHTTEIMPGPSSTTKQRAALLWMGGAVAIAAVASAAVYVSRSMQAPAQMPAQAIAQLPTQPVAQPTVAPVAPRPVVETAPAPVAATSVATVAPTAPIPSPQNSNAASERTAKPAPTPRPAVQASAPSRVAAAAPSAPPAPSKIDLLMQKAQAAQANGDWLEPAGESAVDYYRQILAEHPNHEQAQAGIKEIVQAMIEKARVARLARDFETATQWLDQAHEVQPDYPGLARLQSDLEKIERATSDREHDLLARARVAIAKADKILKHTPIDLGIAAEANKFYDAAARAGQAPEVLALKERMQAAYVAAARYELKRKEPQRALKVITYARRRKLGSPELDEVEGGIK